MARWHVWGCVSLLALAAALVVVVLGSSYWLPEHLWHLGPYKGRPVPPPTTQPSSDLARGDFVLFSYDVEGSPPIVASQRSGGPIVGAWQLVLDPEVEDDEPMLTFEIDHVARTREGYRARGTAVFTSGSTYALLYFDAKGQLREFWLDG